MKRAGLLLGLLGSLGAAPFAVACFSEPDYQGGGRFDSLPGASDDGGAEASDDAAPANDSFVAPPDNFVAPTFDAASGGDS